MPILLKALSGRGISNLRPSGLSHVASSDADILQHHRNSVRCDSVHTLISTSSVQNDCVSSANATYRGYSPIHTNKGSSVRGTFECHSRHSIRQSSKTILCNCCCCTPLRPNEESLSDRTKHKENIFTNVRDIYRKLHMNYLLPLVFIALYMLFGALIFYWLEGPADKEKRRIEYEKYSHERALLLKRMDEIYLDEAAQQLLVRHKFIEEAVDYFHTKIDVAFPADSDWSFVTALYYSGTIFTTIGYGDIACHTPAGRLVSVIYAVFGIPLMLITLNDLGKFLYITINGITRYMKELSCHAHKRGANVHLQDNINVAECGGVEQKSNRSRLLSSPDALSRSRTEDSKSETTKNEIASEEVASDDNDSPPRMPVLVAIGVTVGWIFFCAGLFKIWENDWTYAESCYFMFISLSTIGFGDVAVKRRDLMVLCFVFVILGLSMVSMCVSVIQASIEEIYTKLLMSILLEYHAKLAEGGDRVDASNSMMKMWNANRKTKFLMSLLSKNRKKSVMGKVQENVESKGLEFPEVLMNVDEGTGIPTIFAAKDPSAVDEVLKSVEFMKSSMDASVKSRFSPIVSCDIYTQTEVAESFERNEKPTSIRTSDTVMTTEKDISRMTDTGVQCCSHTMQNNETQTEYGEDLGSGIMRGNAGSSDDDSQKKIVKRREQQLQTQIDLLDASTQTRKLSSRSFKSRSPRRLEMTDCETQTDIISHPTKMQSRLRRAQAQFRKVSQRDRKEHHFEATGDKNSTAASESEESLNWNPRDGMHAERQRSVKDLLRKFNKT
ncbi:hypothetical protein AB6A40_002023 [Gnathostoma spinigerum]|uniref:Potassium channel domain-containing protein n=1 Tax=Gnathostoma spinigerum TaxID=75299 RepID=A0ABD6E5K4_9BILA